MDQPFHPGAAPDQFSVLLRKPDGVALPAVGDRVDRLIVEHGLRVVTRYRLTLSTTDVGDLWPKIVGGSYPIVHAMMDLYMTSGPSEATVVAGPDAVRQCRAIRTEIRRDFGDTVFANRLHTPTEPYEIQPCVEKFLHSIPTGAPYRRHHDSGRAPGVYGRLAALSPEEVRAAARAAWHRQETLGWHSFRMPSASGDHAAYLLPGDELTVDRGMSVIAETLRELTLPQIITAYVEMDVHGRSRLFTGSAAEAGALAERLCAAGLFAEAAPVLTDHQPA
nr:nucleoside-diphosphate kinase [Streptomyces sp. NBC_00886]